MTANSSFLSGQPPGAPTLRPYQAEALQAAGAYLADGGTRALLVLPTGAGKSLLLGSLAASAAQRGERTLILAHVGELVEQNAVACARLAGAERVGTFAASQGKREAYRSITVASIQTVAKRAAELGSIDLVIIDEAHLINPKAETGMYRLLLAELEVLRGRPLPRIGLTATPWRLTSGRLDQPWRDLPPFFEKVVYEICIPDLIRPGYLARPVAKATRTRLETAGIATRQGEFVAGRLQDAIDVDEINRAIVCEIVEAGRDRRSWLIFATGVKHAHRLASLLHEAGITAAAIDGNTPRAEREAAIAAFRSGELQALVGCEIFTTGFDAPNVDLIALCRPTLSPGLHVQMVGRGTRLAPRKTDCLVLDFAGNCLLHGPLDLIDGRDLGQSKGGGEAPAKVCPECATIVPAGARACGECGHDFPPPAPPESKLATAAIVAPLLSDDARAEPGEWLDVEGIGCTRHVKSGKPASLQLEYHVAGRSWPVREWLHFDSPNKIARKIAASRWYRLTGLRSPGSTDEAFSMRGAINCPTRIRVRPSARDPKYLDVVDVDMHRRKAAA